MKECNRDLRMHGELITGERLIYQSRYRTREGRRCFKEWFEWCGANERQTKFVQDVISRGLKECTTCRGACGPERLGIIVETVEDEVD